MSSLNLTIGFFPIFPIFLIFLFFLLFSKLSAHIDVAQLIYELGYSCTAKYVACTDQIVTIVISSPLLPPSLPPSLAIFLSNSIQLFCQL